MIQRQDLKKPVKRFLPENQVTPYAFSGIYKTYRDNIYRLVRARIGKSYDVEDLVQNVFMRVWEYRDELDPDRFSFGLLYRMTLNVVSSYKKHENIVRKHKDYLVNSDPPTADPDILFNEAVSRAEAIVLDLPPVQRDIFTLFLYEGMDRRQIAACKGLSVRTVDNQIYRARKKLKRELTVFQAGD